MDRTGDNYTFLFDRLLKVLSTYRQEDDAAAAAFESLKAVKFNYLQRDLEHLMNNLVRCLNDLSSTSNPNLLNELRSELRGFQNEIFSSTRLASLAREHEAGGGSLSSRDE